MQNAVIHAFAFTSTQGALDAYAFAQLTKSPAAYRAAADQLAKALRSEMQRVKPVAKTELSPALKKIRVPKVDQSDLAAPLGSIPKAKRAHGDFVCHWADGSQTAVSGVVFNRSQPMSAWQAGFQAADRLRRIRGRHAYLASFVNALGVGISIRGACGVEQMSPEWMRLIMIRPMPWLVAIVDDEGERFEPIAGAAFGGGDADEATALESMLFVPSLPTLQPFNPELAALKAKCMAENVAAAPECEPIAEHPHHCQDHRLARAAEA